jgi:hypothetical protein
MLACSAFFSPADELSLGWPYWFYHRFHVYGNKPYNFGWDIKNFIIDELYITGATLVLLIVITSKQKRKK